VSWFLTNTFQARNLPYVVLSPLSLFIWSSRCCGSDSQTFPTVFQYLLCERERRQRLQQLRTTQSWCDTTMSSIRWRPHASPRVADQYPPWDTRSAENPNRTESESDGGVNSCQRRDAADATPSQVRDSQYISSLSWVSDRVVFKMTIMPRARQRRPLAPRDHPTRRSMDYLRHRTNERTDGRTHTSLPARAARCTEKQDRSRRSVARSLVLRVI